MWAGNAKLDRTITAAYPLDTVQLSVPEKAIVYRSGCGCLREGADSRYDILLFKFRVPSQHTVDL